MSEALVDESLLLAVRVLRANWPTHPDATSSIRTMVAVVPSAERVAESVAAVDHPLPPEFANEAAWLLRALGRYYLDVDLPIEAGRHLEAALRLVGHTDRNQVALYEIDLADAEYRSCIVADTVPERFERALARIEALLDTDLTEDMVAWPLAQARRELYQSDLGDADTGRDPMAELYRRRDEWDLTPRERFVVCSRHAFKLRDRPDTIETALSVLRELHADLEAEAPDSRAAMDCLNVVAITARRLAADLGFGASLQAWELRQDELALAQARSSEALLAGSPLAASYQRYLSRSLNNLVALAVQMNRLDEAEQYATEAIGLIDAGLTSRLGTLGVRYGSAGIVSLARLDFGVARDRFDRAVELGDQVGNRKGAMRRAGSLLAVVLGNAPRADISAVEDDLRFRFAGGQRSSPSRTVSALALSDALHGKPAALDEFDEARQLLALTHSEADLIALRVDALKVIGLRLLGLDDEAETLELSLHHKLERTHGSADHWLARWARLPVASLEDRPP